MEIKKRSKKYTNYYAQVEKSDYSLKNKLKTSRIMILEFKHSSLISHLLKKKIKSKNINDFRLKVFQQFFEKRKTARFISLQLLEE